MATHSYWPMDSDAGAAMPYHGKRQRFIRLTAQSVCCSNWRECFMVIMCVRNAVVRLMHARRGVYSPRLG